MAGYLLVNPRSGGGSPTAEELREEAEGLGVRVHVLQPGEDAAELAREADATALGMAGGDGSLAPVAAVALERDLPFVCIPFGTRNHFARDAGLDRDDPLGSLAAFDGREIRIDVGEVEGRVFLNNVSLGVYADLVRHREHHRRRGESLARLRALSRIVRKERRPLVLELDGERLEVRAALVSNNAYELSALSLGERTSLDEGMLHFYCAESLLPGGWTDRRCTELRLRVPGRPAVRTAIDGEPVALGSELHFRVRPQALRLLLPPS